MPDFKGNINSASVLHSLVEAKSLQLAELCCQSYLEQCSLRKLRSLEELHGFRTTDSSIFVLVSHSEPVVE